MESIFGGGKSKELVFARVGHLMTSAFSRSHPNTWKRRCRCSSGRYEKNTLVKSNKYNGRGNDSRTPLQANKPCENRRSPTGRWCDEDSLVYNDVFENPRNPTSHEMITTHSDEAD